MSEERGEYRHGNHLAQQGNQNAAKPESEKLSAQVQVRTTQAHKELMQSKSALEGISLNEWILRAIERAEKMSTPGQYAEILGAKADSL